MANDLIARALALEAMKHAGAITGVESVNGKNGDVTITLDDLHGESKETIKKYSLGRVYATMQPEQTADITQMIGDIDAFKSFCEDYYEGIKKILIIDGLVADIISSTRSSIEVSMHETYDVDGIILANFYYFALVTSGNKVVLECVSNIELELGAKADWNEQNPNKNGYIKNKPIIPDSNVVSVTIEKIEQSAQGYTIITIDKTRQEIVNATANGKSVILPYDGKIFYYSDANGGGFHHIDMITNMIMTGVDNEAIGIKDICFIFNGSYATTNKLTLTRINFTK